LLNFLFFFHRRLIFHFSTKNRSPKFPKNAKTYFSPSVFVFQSLLKAFIPQKITFANKKMIYLQKNLISTLKMVSRKKEKQIKNRKDLKYLFYKKDYLMEHSWFLNVLARWVWKKWESVCARIQFCAITAI